MKIHGHTSDGRHVVLDVASDDVAEGMRVARKQGITVTSVEQGKAALPATTGRASSFPLLLFSQELLSLLDAGLNLTEALATLVAKERQPAVRHELQRILDALRRGQNLSDVLGTAPKIFPEVYVATMRASERTGDLGRALGRYITYQTQFDEIRKKIVSAAIYPSALLVVGGLVFLFLLGYVVPRFSVVYDSSGRDIPWLSRLMLDLGKLIHGHWQWVAAAAVALLFGTIWAMHQPAMRRALLDGLLRLPWLARKSDEFRLARFYRAVSLLLASGIALPRAIGMVNGLLSASQQGRLQSAQLAVNQGQSLSTALVAAQLATPVAESLMKVGERSGQMAEMLDRTASFHDQEFARWIDWASRLLEPVLMALIGVVIGAVVLLMYMPIFELAGSLQ